MRPGRANKHVILQNLSATRDAMGAYREGEWTPSTPNMWASIEPVSGKEWWYAGKAEAEITHSVNTWYRGDLTINTDSRIKYGTRIFDIDSVINPREANRELIIVAKERL